MKAVEEIRRHQRAEGPATVLAIGSATPVNCVDQFLFPDYYLRITNNEHKTELKQKLKRICENTMIKKRYMHLTEELIKKNPSITTYMAPSLDARQDITVVEIPKLGKEAAEKAISECGHPKSSITHLIFCTSTSIDMPGADYQLAKLLGLRPTVKRFAMYYHGCYGGASALHMAKDLAENIAGARVLIVCCEIMATLFHSPNEAYADNLIVQALFGDGAAAVIVGSDPVAGEEFPLFQIVSAAQTTIPDSESAVQGHLREAGLVCHLHRDVPKFVSNNILRSLEEAFEPLGISDWNSIFWVVHPGGRAILDKMEGTLGLKPEKLRVARRVLREYGNVSSVSVLLVLDEMRKSSAVEGRSSTGEGLDWGVLFGFGPGITMETLVLRSMKI